MAGHLYAWATAYMLFGLPLTMFFLPKMASTQRAAGPVVKPHSAVGRTMILLSSAFAAASGFCGMMIGPAQVAARVLDANRYRQNARCQRRAPERTRGTLPLTIFGPENYAYRLGLIDAPSRICQALAPVGFGLLMGPMSRALWRYRRA